MTGRALNRLTATQVANIKDQGRHSDGGGLYLFVDATRRRWVFIYKWKGRRIELGLGSARSLPLAKARQKASEFREMISEGKNPKAERKREERIISFGDYADAYVETMSPSWKNAKHIAQWKMTLGCIDIQDSQRLRCLIHEVPQFAEASWVSSVTS